MKPLVLLAIAAFALPAVSRAQEPSTVRGVPAPRPVQAPLDIQAPQTTVTQPVETSSAPPAASELVPAPEADTGDAPALPPKLPDLSESNTRSAGGEGPPDARAAIPKALRSSGTQAGGPANDLNPSGVPQAPVEAKGELGAVVTGRALFHGNYCGAGQRGVGLPPIDDLDAACMHHDACYDSAGYHSCGCDRALRQEASAVSERPSVALEVRRRALSVAEAASVMECRQP